MTSVEERILLSDADHYSCFHRHLSLVGCQWEDLRAIRNRHISRESQKIHNIGTQWNKWFSALLKWSMNMVLKDSSKLAWLGSEEVLEGALLGQNTKDWTEDRDWRGDWEDGCSQQPSWRRDSVLWLGRIAFDVKHLQSTPCCDNSL